MESIRPTKKWTVEEATGDVREFFSGPRDVFDAPESPLVKAVIEYCERETA